MQPPEKTIFQPFTAAALFLVLSIITGCRQADITQPSAHAGGPPQASRTVEPDQTRPLLEPAQQAAVMEALRLELNRSRTQLKAREFPAPYFIAYRLNDLSTVSIAARAGGVYEDNHDRQRGLYTEVRVGDYGFDNTGGSRYQGGGFGFFGWSRPPMITLDANVGAIRFDLWSGTDSAYKQAVSKFFERKAKTVSRVDRYKTASFSKETPVRHTGPSINYEPNRDVWREQVRKISELFREHPEVINSDVRYTAYGMERYLMNTEGTSLADASTNYLITIAAEGRADDGQSVETVRYYYGRTPDDLPPFEKLAGDASQITEELLKVRKAPVQTPYTGPAILSAAAAGVFFHEAVGHRLEGERQDDDEGGQTFADKLETQVIPEFLDVYDDPNQDREGSVTLNGHYLYDDEGVPAGRVTLIKAGVLKDFLLSRTPIRMRDRSNGHGRASMFSAPIARIGNLIVRSSRTVSREKLFEELRAEARRQGKPYGLYVEEVEGGETNTSRWGVQTFKGVARKLYQVDTETGALTLVRGADIVGTPLASIRKISVTGDDYQVFNGFCGAESGFIPVSAVAPSVLVTEIELQRRSEEPLTQPVLPPPSVKN